MQNPENFDDLSIEPEENQIPAMARGAQTGLQIASFVECQRPFRQFGNARTQLTHERECPHRIVTGDVFADFGNFLLRQR